MKITLISPPWFFKRRADCRSQNLGLGYLASYLERGGHEVKIIDALTEGINKCFKVRTNSQSLYQIGLSYPEIVARIPRDTDYIGLTAPFTSLAPIIRELAFNIKRVFSKTPLILGGVYPSTMPEEALTDSIDYLIKGEGEKALLELVSGKTSQEVTGLVFRHQGRVADNGTTTLISDLDSLPFPARHLLPMEKYLRCSPRGVTTLRTASIITSRGCPYDCTFCSIHPVYGWRWRARSAQNVLKEIKALIRDYKIELIEFEDDNLTLKEERAREIFNGLVEINRHRKDKILWSTPNGIRVDILDEEFLLRMKESGCIFLNLGLESGDPEILQKMNKKVDRRKVEEVIRICDQIGLRASIFLMVGYPGETLKHYQNSLSYARYLKSLGAKSFAVFTAKAYPGTKLYQYCQKNNYLVNSQEPTLWWDTGGYGNIATPDFDLEEVKRRQEEANSILNKGLWPEKMINFARRYLPKPVKQGFKRLFR